MGKKKKLRAIDLYSGVGGWSLGLRLAGIDVVASYDLSGAANETTDGQETTQVPATKGVKFPRIGKPGWLRNDDIGILIVVAAAIIAGVTIGIINSQQSKAVTPPGP